MDVIDRILINIVLIVIISIIQHFLELATGVKVIGSEPRRTLYKWIQYSVGVAIWNLPSIFR